MESGQSGHSLFLAPFQVESENGPTLKERHANLATIAKIGQSCQHQNREQFHAGVSGSEVAPAAENLTPGR